MNIIATPEGSRDRLSAQCRSLRAVQEELTGLFRAKGYEEIGTPEAEHYDLFLQSGDPIPQCGIELLGAGGVEADVEAVSLAVKRGSDFYGTYKTRRVATKYRQVSGRDGGVAMLSIVTAGGGKENEVIASMRSRAAQAA